MSKNKVNSETPADYTFTKPGQIIDVPPGTVIFPPGNFIHEDKVIEMALAALDKHARRGDLMSDPRKAGDFLRLKLAKQKFEVFAVIFLDNQHRMIAYQEMFHGGLDGAEVHPRVVLEACLIHNASAVIFGHNHPSGNTQPSSADRAVTSRLKQALALCDIRMLDHFIIGDGEPTSMAELGMV